MSSQKSLIMGKRINILGQSTVHSGVSVQSVCALLCLIYMVCVGSKGGGGVRRGCASLLAVHTIYILYSTRGLHIVHIRLWHPDASLALWHIGSHTDFGWPLLWLHFISFYFHFHFHSRFGFHFLVASFRCVFLHFIFWGRQEKVLLLRYGNAFSDFAQLQLWLSIFAFSFCCRLNFP